jgi:hypothetical protein
MSNLTDSGTAIIGGCITEIADDIFVKILAQMMVI